MKSVAQLEKELEDIREGLLVALQSPHSLQYIDLMFLAQQVGDIKQELRIARANEL